MNTVVLLLVIFSLGINFAYTNSINLVNNDSDGVEVWKPRQCLPADCNSHCLRLGHVKGDCAGNFCQCRLQSSAVASLRKESLSNPDEPSTRFGCNLLSCMNLCRALGFRYFSCLTNGACRCWN